MSLSAGAWSKAMLNKPHEGARLALAWTAMRKPQPWRGFATPQTARRKDARPARDLFSIALGCLVPVSDQQLDSNLFDSSTYFC